MTSRDWYNDINVFLRKKTFQQQLEEEKKRSFKYTYPTPAHHKICKYCMYCQHTPKRKCLLTPSQRLTMEACYKARNLMLLKENNLYGEKVNSSTSTN